MSKPVHNSSGGSVAPSQRLTRSSLTRSISGRATFKGRQTLDLLPPNPLAWERFRNGGPPSVLRPHMVACPRQAPPSPHRFRVAEGMGRRAVARNSRYDQGIVG
jgi:hypothetical protein